MRGSFFALYKEFLEILMINGLDQRRASGWVAYALPELLSFVSVGAYRHFWMFVGV